MELRFNATEIGCQDDGHALVCGASNSKANDLYHYITIQGSSGPDDDGIHFEIDDQINGSYNLLASCSVSRNQITVDLLHDVPWYPGVRRIVVCCDSAPSEQFNTLVAGPRRLFRDRPSDLHIAPP